MKRKFFRIIFMIAVLIALIVAIRSKFIPTE